ncbi:MAG: Transducin family WD-40 repeat family isoform 3 [Trebouxia sp. A1-2]|nr:MAG: Transducin family WD-40 repeat family isoform 3 [Trebouxia sp. A1-2]
MREDRQMLTDSDRPSADTLGGRPIASLAFHIEGDALAVASGHKLYMWQYTRQQQGEEGAPAVALKTRRSLRAVHFHPLGLPLVLTAEVNDVSAPVTLPHGHPPPPTPQASAPLPRSAGYQGPVHADLPRQLSVEAAGISQDHTSSHAQQDDDDWPIQRPPHRRLSEVFRALMQEEREEELLAQLESSASQQASQMHSSASRQILGMTGYSHGHSIRQHDHVPTQSQSLSHRSSAGLGSLPHPPVPIRQLRPRSRPRSFHPLRHSIAGDALASSSTPIMQQMSTPFDNPDVGSHPSASSSGMPDAASTEQDSGRENPIQQRAQAWAQQRQRESSVLSQHDSSELEPVTRTYSGLADMSGFSVRSQGLHTSSQPAHDWSPYQSPRRLSRRQSEPSRSGEDEWPALGTPPVTLHLPLTSPRRLPAPSPGNPPGQSTGQQLSGSQAAVGFGWAANLARGAEWMGEATGLRFLTRPFSRTVAGMTGVSVTAAAVEQTAASSSDAAASSSDAQRSPDDDMQTLERAASLSQQVSASAPSNGSMSYRERLLAGSATTTSWQTNGQASGRSMPRVSPSQPPSEGSQIGFPTQQELQALQSTLERQSSASAAASVSSAPAGSLLASASAAPAVSALTLGPTSLDGQSRRQIQPPSGSTTPSGRRSSADLAQGSLSNAPQPIPVLTQAATAPRQARGAQAAVGTQTGLHVGTQLGAQSSPAPAALGFMTWPAQLAADPQGMAALPPSMLNMGWEYPAQLLQGPDPEPAARHRVARDDAGQQPNHVVAVRASAAAANIIGTEQPCRVRLRLWHCCAADPTAALEVPSLTIPDAVLCSEMGVHFSACGRYLAACVACQAGHLHDLIPDAAGIIYEVRVYSLEAASLGHVLHAKQIRAAHCLTSVQFSPTSEHLLLAYGRRHISLLRSLVPDGTSSIIPVHTILEVYRVSDMSLVRVLPSAEDEVNAAAFHPHAGEGLAYGTKEGKLRILRHDPRPEARTLATCQQPRGLEDELREAESIYEDDIVM